jgi:hypothetical protein
MNSPLSAQLKTPITPTAPYPIPQSRGKDAPPPTHLTPLNPRGCDPKHNPKNDPLTEVLVKIGSKKVADVKGVKAIKRGIRKISCADWRVA